jgi:hypothetical protein
MTELFAGVTITGVTSTLRTTLCIWLPPSATPALEIHARIEELLYTGNARRRANAITESFIYLFCQGTRSRDGHVLVEATFSHHL